MNRKIKDGQKRFEFIWLSGNMSDTLKIKSLETVHKILNYY